MWFELENSYYYGVFCSNNKRTNESKDSTVKNIHPRSPFTRKNNWIRATRRDRTEFHMFLHPLKVIENNLLHINQLLTEMGFIGLPEVSTAFTTLVNCPQWIHFLIFNASKSWTVALIVSQFRARPAWGIQ